MKKNPIEMIQKAGQNGEPTFTLRAKDLFSLTVIDEYIYVLESYIQDKDNEHLKGVKEIRQEFMDWRKANEDKVQIPD